MAAVLNQGWMFLYIVHSSDNTVFIVHGGLKNLCTSIEKGFLGRSKGAF